MQFGSNILFLGLLYGAQAASDASVFLFPQAPPTTSNAPSLTPAEARLIFAHRLGASRYHDLGVASDGLLRHINDFGGSPSAYLDTNAAQSNAELVLIIDGLPSADVRSWLGVPVAVAPAFTITQAPSPKANEKLAGDLSRQIGVTTECAWNQAINPFERDCWGGSKSKIMHIEMSKAVKNAHALSDLQHTLTRVLAFTSRGELNAAIVIMPPTSSSKGSYGTYDMPSRGQLHQRSVTEAPMMTDFLTPEVPDPIEARVANASIAPVRGVIPMCFSSLDACNTVTKNCSSHGTCGRRYGPNGDSSSAPATNCFTCLCGNSTDYDNEGNAVGITHWAGGACQKKDISGPFWLIVSSTVVLVGIVTWAIAMLFSIGEEKLPGVIGAGVSSKSR